MEAQDIFPNDETASISWDRLTTEGTFSIEIELEFFKLESLMLLPVILEILLWFSSLGRA